MKVDNPYSDMVGLIERRGAKNNPPSIQIGTIISIPPNIIVKIGDLQIDKDNIYIADYLLADYQREISIPESTATGNTNDVTVGDHGTHAHIVKSVGISDVTVSTKSSALKKDDIVAVLAVNDRQKYVILCKVVDLNG